MNAQTRRRFWRAASVDLICCERDRPEGLKTGKGTEDVKARAPIDLATFNQPVHDEENRGPLATMLAERPAVAWGASYSRGQQGWLKDTVAFMKPERM